MPPQSFLWFCRRIRLFGISWLATACLLSLLSGLVQPLRAEIKIVSYLLRDRAVVLDSLVLRKAMYFSFKSTEPVSRLKGAMVEGILSIEDDEAARDTSFLFDEAGGNIAFYLPYEIPDGTYNLKIKITSGKGKVLESFSGDFGRDELRAYFKRGQNFWDFTMPYAHLECRGHGELTYHFKSKKAVKPRSLELSARIMSDNRFPALAELSLNGVELGRFELPSADNKDPKVITWRVDNPEALDGLTIQPGENRLSISIPREINIRGMGIRIYAHKNSPDPAVENAVPIILKATPKEGKAKETVYRIPVWGEDGEHISSKFIIPGPESFTKEVIETEQEPFPLTQADIKNGYVLFQKNFLHYVYPWTIPARDEKIDSLDIRISRNDYEPLAFSIYPVRDLGAVRVSAGDLQGPGGSVISSDNVVIHLAKIMKVRTGGTKYRLIPKMLERTDCACIPLDYTTRFWLTVHADKAVAPGLYRGAIRVEPEKEPALELPLTVEVLPITLEQVPGIAYSMFLSYEFFELDSKPKMQGAERYIGEK
ncbi:MAG: hypothetical protein U9P14_05795 [Gemmatimonadota bacterium]|nr:hypothetical protein [Gemmatimonadota bacterium]